MTKSTDRIEKTIDLKAPLARVWKAISDSRSFGAWFKCAIEGPFVAGQRSIGRITSAGRFEGVRIEMLVEAIEPETRFAYRWHPYAVDAGRDYSSEPTTLVEMRLEEIAGGTRLTVVESGFDAIPAARRAEAYRMNDGGWAAQLENVARWVEAPEAARAAH